MRVQYPGNAILKIYSNNNNDNNKNLLTTGIAVNTELHGKKQGNEAGESRRQTK